MQRPGSTWCSISAMTLVRTLSPVARNQYSVPFVATHSCFRNENVSSSHYLYDCCRCLFLLLFVCAFFFCVRSSRGDCGRNGHQDETPGHFDFWLCFWLLVSLQLFLTHTLPVCLCDHVVVRLLLRGLVGNRCIRSCQKKFSGRLQTRFSPTTNMIRAW